MGNIASFFNELPSYSKFSLHDFDYSVNQTYEASLSILNTSNIKASDTLTDGKTTNKNVAVILGYYNGNSYLPEQIRSILEQSHKNLEIFVSDDCSTLEVDVKRLGLTTNDTKKIHLGVRSFNIGCTNNFLDALGKVDSLFEYFSFSDQDDVWHKDKVEDALAVIARYPDDKPVLYCARTAITNEDCQVDLGISPLFEKKPSFANALVQNIGGGNTMVFNKAARDLIVTSSINVEVVAHDWWCYQIVSGAGGVIQYDTKPCLKYRQHSGNLVGSNNDWRSRLIRIRGLLNCRFRNWNNINLKALSKNRALLTPDNQQRLNDFIRARESPLIKRLILFKSTRIYRQTFLGNLGLVLGLILNKV